MSANFDRMIKSFMKSIKKQIDEKPKGYDTPAKVVRIQDGIAWVHIDGGVDETPVKLTVNAKKGDTVQVRLSNGTGFIVGNVSAPPTDDTKAIDAQQTASGARADALKAQQDALNAKIAADQNAVDMAQAVVAINADIEDLQSQIDGNITSWFYDTDPAMNKPPVTVDPSHPEGTGWDTDEKKQNHVGDLYYNVDSGDSWRFVYIDGAYSWTAITDSAATQALAIASQAQDTADSKRRVFIAQPTPPYDVGDLWMQGANGDIMTCTTAKASGDVYALSDWTKLNAYTDDTRANAAYTLASSAQTAANGKNKVYYTASAPTGGTYNDGDIWFNTSNGYQMSLYVENTGWVAEQFGGAAISDLAITNAKIANGTIQSAKISGLDVGKLTGGYIDASHINAGTLTIGMSQVTDLTTTLDGKADGSDIPTKVSDLDNDSSFATTSQVTTAKNQAVSAAATDATNKANSAAQTATSYIGIETDGIKVGKNIASTTDYMLITGSGQDLVAKGVTLAHFGYATGKDSSGSTSSDKYPYYTFGTRSSDTSSTRGNYSFVEGLNNKASAIASHAEGYNCEATGFRSHAEGAYTNAVGANSHSEGWETEAAGANSHASGEYTTAGYTNQFVCGQFNSNQSSSLFEVGNGANHAPSNAFSVDSSGNIYTKNDNTNYIGKVISATEASTSIPKTGTWTNAGNQVSLTKGSWIITTSATIPSTGTASVRKGLRIYNTSDSSVCSDSSILISSSVSGEQCLSTTALVELSASKNFKAQGWLGSAASSAVSFTVNIRAMRIG